MDLGTFSLDQVCIAKRALPVIVLASFWRGETWNPFYCSLRGQSARVPLRG